MTDEGQVVEEDRERDRLADGLAILDGSEGLAMATLLNVQVLVLADIAQSLRVLTDSALRREAVDGEG